MKPETISDVRVMLGADYVKLMTFTEIEGVVEARAKGRIARIMWNEIVRKVEDMGGKYQYGAFHIPLGAKGEGNP